MRAERAENTLEKVDEQIQIVEKNTGQMKLRAKQAEKSSKQWQQKFNTVKKQLDETRDIVVLHEGLINKLTE